MYATEEKRDITQHPVPVHSDSMTMGPNNAEGDVEVPHDFDEFDKQDGEFEIGFGYQDTLRSLKEYCGEISVSILNQKQRNKLGQLLDRERPAGIGGDCLDLASRLFPHKCNDELLLKISKQKKPTAHVLDKFCKDMGPQATIFTLIDAFVSMKRLDVVQILLKASKDYLDKKKKNSGFSTGDLLTRIKRKLFKDDTISIDSVSTISSISTLSSYPSSESLSSIFHVHDVEMPLKERPPSVNGMDNFKPALDNVGMKVRKGSLNKGSSKLTVFVVSASDKIKFSIRLVQWLRDKGVEAKNIETDSVDFQERPFDYVNGVLQKANYVLIVCSKGYMDVIDNASNGRQDVHGITVKNIHQYMCAECFNSGGYLPKYIPVLLADTSTDCIPLPLGPTMACHFDVNCKENRADLLRRLYREEKFKLRPVASRPNIVSKLITGDD